MNIHQAHKEVIDGTINECITPTCEELNYETSQVKCPYRETNILEEKCQKLFKNIMALNVHLQMYHRQIGLLTVSKAKSVETRVST